MTEVYFVWALMQIAQFLGIVAVCFAALGLAGWVVSEAVEMFREGRE